jgi:hypothetical protein
MGIGAALVVGAMASSCGSLAGSDSTQQSAQSTESSPQQEPGSGAFVVATAPDGWVLDGAYSTDERGEPPFRQVAYANLRNPNLRWTINGYALDPEAATKQLNEQAAALDDPAITKVDVQGHVAFVGERRRDDGTTETIVGWSVRPDLLVTVSVTSDTGLDAVTLANDVQELSEEAYRAAAEATVSGKRP